MADTGKNRAETLAASLEQLTAGWTPARGVPIEALTAARQSIASSLVSGITSTDIHAARLPVEARPPVNPKLSSDLLHIVTDALAAKQPRTTAVIRSALAADISNPLGRPAWTRGAAIAQSFGPFEDANGIINWVDLITLTRSIQFAFGNAASPFGVFPVRGTLIGQVSQNRLSLGAGSVWFLARLLANTLPAGQFTGLSITGGTLQSSAALALQNGVYVVPANATLTVHLNLAPGAVPGPGTAGPDAAHARFTPPASVTMVFRQNSAAFQAIDDFSVTAYGSNIHLHRNNQPVVQTPGLPVVLIPCDAAPARLAFNQVESEFFVPSGAADISLAGWALPLTSAAISALPEAAGAGTAFLEIQQGASIATQTAPNPAPVAHGILDIGTGFLYVVMQGKAKAVRNTYQLWPEAPPSERNSTLEFETPAAFLCAYLSTPDQETLLTQGNAVGHLDRPLAADGSRFVFHGAGFLAITHSSAATTLFAFATRGPNQDPLVSVALENALLGVEAPSALIVQGALNDHDVTSGTAAFYFNLRWLLPTLPDPYASNNDLELIRRQVNAAPLGTLLAATRWNPTATPPTLTFQLLQPLQLAAGNNGGFLAVGRGFGVGLALLDLSTRVDLFGVATFPAAQRFAGGDDQRGNLLEDPAFQNPAGPAPAMAFTGLRLALNSSIAVTFALPQVSWEPMESSAFPAAPIYCDPASDGFPLIVSAPDNQKLVPFMPEPVLLGNIDRVALGRSFTAIFSLPFGLNAVITQTNRALPGRPEVRSLFHSQGGVFRANQPEFKERFFPDLDPTGEPLAGAVQLRLKPPFPDREDAQFGGFTVVDAAHGPRLGIAPDGYGFTVIGSSPGVGQIFDQDFGSAGAVRGVPVRQIDLSGYGASIFSEWKQPNKVPPAIIKVDFETTIGRTGHEVIQAASVIYPYGPRVVRTVTMQRHNAGWVQRTDTGWQPASHGLFEFPPDPAHGVNWANSVHKGPLVGAFNIRNIRETLEVETFPNPADAAHPFKFQKVFFDADFGVDPTLNVLTGGFHAPAAGVPSPPVFVAGRDIIGYLQVEPNRQTPDQSILQKLLHKTGPLTPAIHCMVEAGHIANQTGTVMRCSAFEVNIIDATNTGAKVPAIGVALRGAPQIPRGGGWSLGRRKFNEAAPTALPNDFPAPLVRPTGGPNFWYLADTTDILQLSQPDNFYSLLHATGTNKVLFESPQIPNAGPTAGLQFLKPAPPGLPKPGAAPVNAGSPNLGDIASILGATGLFPDIANALSLLQGPLEQINTVTQGFHYSKSHTFNANQKSTLIDLGIISIDMQYADTTTPALPPAKLEYSVNSAASPSWSLSIGTLSFLVTVPLFGNSPILTITGGFKADEHTKAGLTDLNVQLGDALSIVKGVFSRLQTLAQFLPGGAGVNLDVALSNGRLTVRDSFTIGDLPLGLGNLKDISLNLGLGVQLSPLSVDFLVGVGSEEHPFNWIVSPLAGTGLMQFGVIESQPSFTIQAGLGLGLAIDLGIASGSASITLAVQLDITGNKITLMAILTGRASVDVLGGLASASLTISAALGFSLSPIIPPITFHPALPAVPTSVTLGSEEITLLAVCSVGIHISICWVISISWDGSWKFSQSVNTPEITLGI